MEIQVNLSSSTITRQEIVELISAERERAKPAAQKFYNYAVNGIERMSGSEVQNTIKTSRWDDIRGVGPGIASDIRKYIVLKQVGSVSNPSGYARAKRHMFVNERNRQFQQAVSNGHSILEYLGKHTNRKSGGFVDMSEFFGTLIHEPMVWEYVDYGDWMKKAVKSQYHAFWRSLYSMDKLGLVKIEHTGGDTPKARLSLTPKGWYVYDSYRGRVNTKYDIRYPSIR